MPEFETTQRDATNVGPQIPPEEQARQDAISEAHIDASINTLIDMGIGVVEGAGVGVLTGVGTGPGVLPSTVGGAIIGGNLGYAKGVYNNCGNCHLQYPPKEPPVPEIETEDEEEKEKKLKELLGENP